MLQYAPTDMTTIQRVFGMTLCSMPFWLLCGGYALATHGLPGSGQIVQSLAAAVFSGVIATILFFEATNLVRGDPKKLAIVEATQSGEVLFTLLGGILFLGDPMPSAAGFAGILIIVIGMIANSLSGCFENQAEHKKDRRGIFILRRSFCVADITAFWRRRSQCPVPCGTWPRCGGRPPHRRRTADDKESGH